MAHLHYCRVAMRPDHSPHESSRSPYLRDRLRQCLDLDGHDRRQIADNRRPGIAGISRRVYLTARRTEIHPARVERVDGHCVAQHVDVAVALRQAFREGLPLMSARAAAV